MKNTQIAKTWSRGNIWSKMQDIKQRITAKNNPQNQKLPISQRIGKSICSLVNRSRNGQNSLHLPSQLFLQTGGGRGKKCRKLREKCGNRGNQQKKFEHPLFRNNCEDLNPNHKALHTSLREREEGVTPPLEGRIGRPSLSLFEKIYHKALEKNLG